MDLALNETNSALLLLLSKDDSYHKPFPQNSKLILNEKRII